MKTHYSYRTKFCGLWNNMDQFLCFFVRHCLNSFILFPLCSITILEIQPSNLGLFYHSKKKMLRWLDNVKSCLCTSSALVLPRLVGASALTLATSAKMSMRSKLLTNQRITFTLTFFMAMFPLYRNQSIDLQYKSRREWLSGFRHCDRIGRFPVQTPLAAQLALGT